jgi:uncharacterized protein
MPMQDKVVINLPFKDLDASKAFFARLSYAFSPQVTGARSADYVHKPMSDADKATEALIALFCAGKEGVEKTADAAIAL